MGKNGGRDHEHQVAINDEITKISTEILQKNIDSFAMRRWLTRELAIARIKLNQSETELKQLHEDYAHPATAILARIIAAIEAEAAGH